MADNFDTNLMRFIAASFYLSLSLQASREMFGKSYFSLGVGERAIVDQALQTTVAANYQAVTPEYLKGTTPATAGFQAPGQAVPSVPSEKKP
jgi:hypothetical protein